MLKFNPDESRDESGKWTSGPPHSQVAAALTSDEVDGVLTDIFGTSGNSSIGQRPQLTDYPEPTDAERDSIPYNDRPFQVDRRAWDYKVDHALSTGTLTQAEAEAKGAFLPDEWKPLPPDLYHVTTAATAVGKSGGLKTRDELSMDRAQGLGGGESNTISFTEDPAIADSIRLSMVEAHDVASGKITIPDLLAKATSGDTGSKPFITDMMANFGTQDWKPGDPYPEGLQSAIDGVKRDMNAAGKTEEEFNARMAEEGKPTGWKGVQSDHPLGANAFIRFVRPSTPHEKADLALHIYKIFSAYREYAGGRMDPLFFGSDPDALAQMDPNEIQVIHTQPTPGGQGYQMSALGEWRTRSGDAVKIVGMKKSSALRRFLLPLRLRKANPYHDAQGHFTDKLHAVDGGVDERKEKRALRAVEKFGAAQSIFKSPSGISGGWRLGNVSNDEDFRTVFGESFRSGEIPGPVELAYLNGMLDVTRKVRMAIDLNGWIRPEAYEYKLKQLQLRMDGRGKDRYGLNFMAGVMGEANATQQIIDELHRHPMGLQHLPQPGSVRPSDRTVGNGGLKDIMATNPSLEEAAAIAASQVNQEFDAMDKIYYGYGSEAAKTLVVRGITERMFAAYPDTGSPTDGQFDRDLALFGFNVDDDDVNGYIPTQNPDVVITTDGKGTYYQNSISYQMYFDKNHSDTPPAKDFGKKPVPVDATLSDRDRAIRNIVADSPQWAFGGTPEAIQLGREAGVSKLVKQWAITANDDNNVSLALQEAARQEFGLDDNPDLAPSQWRRSGIVGMDVGTQKEYDRNGNLYRAFLRSQYDITQEFFAERGIQNLELFRGMSGSMKDNLVDTNDGDVLTMGLRPLSSWATTSGAAYNFYRDNGALVNAIVPVSRVLSTSLTGNGCLHEDEATVIGQMAELQLLQSEWKSQDAAEDTDYANWINAINDFAGGVDAKIAWALENYGKEDYLGLGAMWDESISQDIEASWSVFQEDHPGAWKKPNAVNEYDNNPNNEFGFMFDFMLAFHDDVYETVVDDGEIPSPEELDAAFKIHISGVNDEILEGYLDSHDTHPDETQFLTAWLHEHNDAASVTNSIPVTPASLAQVWEDHQRGMDYIHAPVIPETPGQMQIPLLRSDAEILDSAIPDPEASNARTPITFIREGDVFRDAFMMETVIALEGYSPNKDGIRVRVLENGGKGKEKLFSSPDNNPVQVYIDYATGRPFGDHPPGEMPGYYAGDLVPRPLQLTGKYDSASPEIGKRIKLPRPLRQQFGIPPETNPTFLVQNVEGHGAGNDLITVTMKSEDGSSHAYQWDKNTNVFVLGINHPDSVVNNLAIFPPVSPSVY